MNDNIVECFELDKCLGTFEDEPKCKICKNYIDGKCKYNIDVKERITTYE